ncbi:Putative ribonuclease H protein At1g65750 [Linum perenne]
MLWKARNERLFADGRDSASSVAFRSVNWARQVTLASRREGITIEREARNFLLDVRWEPGPDGWIVLNSDGSVHQQTGRAAAGGLIRDSGGRCLLAYSMNLGSCSITRAEIRGAIEGLVRAWDAGFRKIVLRSDSKAAVSILSNVDNLDHRHASLVEQFQALKNQDWEVSIHHIFREANNAADYLAKLGHDLALGTHVFLYPDSNILYWLSFDLVGSCLPRIINNIA